MPEYSIFSLKSMLLAGLMIAGTSNAANLPDINSIGHSVAGLTAKNLIGSSMFGNYTAGLAALTDSLKSKSGTTNLDLKKSNTAETIPNVPVATENTAGSIVDTKGNITGDNTLVNKIDSVQIDKIVVTPIIDKVGTDSFIGSTNNDNFDPDLLNDG